LKYLHRLGFVHRDIKPENILLGANGRAFIADLGYTTVWSKKVKMNSSCGSLSYASPEILNSKLGYFGPEVDVWSLGVVIFMMNSGRFPFSGADAFETGTKILCCEYRVPSSFSRSLTKLIIGMLEKQAKKRITIEQVLKSDWVKLGNSNNVLERAEDFPTSEQNTSQSFFPHSGAKKAMGKVRPGELNKKESEETSGARQISMDNSERTTQKQRKNTREI